MGFFLEKNDNAPTFVGKKRENFRLGYSMKGVKKIEQKSE